VLNWLLAAGIFGLLVADITAHRSRKRFFQVGDAFRCRLRACGYTSVIWPRLTRRWSRPMWAAWSGDVLMVRRGPVLARTIPLLAQVSPYGVHPLAVREVRWCGRHPIAVGLQVWDGSRVEVAADTATRLALVGPYLVAALDHRPPAPIPRRQA
jgi:hypothetical protein